MNFHINLTNRCIKIKEEHAYFHTIQNSSSGTNYNSIKKEHPTRDGTKS